MAWRGVAWRGLGWRGMGWDGMESDGVNWGGVAWGGLGRMDFQRAVFAWGGARTTAAPILGLGWEGPCCQSRCAAGAVILDCLAVSLQRPFFLFTCLRRTPGHLLKPFPLLLPPPSSFLLLPPRVHSWLINSSRNRQIDARNAARAAAAGLLNGPAAVAGWVADKLAAARQLGSSSSASASNANLVDRPFERQLAPPRLGPRLVGDDDVVYDSGREAEPQLLERDLDDWDSRLSGREAGGGGAGARRAGGGGGTRGSGSGNGGVARGGRFRR